jgi:hypothetical protein
MILEIVVDNNYNVGTQNRKDMLKKCTSKWCFNFYVQKRKDKLNCTKDCGMQYANYKRGLHYWYRLENPEKCIVNNCTNNINPKARKYCDNHCNYKTAIKKGYKQQVINEEQYCQVCDRIFYKKNIGKFCSDICFKKSINGRSRDKYKKTNDRYKVNNKYKYFYLMENDEFYKYGISNNIKQRKRDHEAQGLKLVFYTTGKSTEILKYESLIKTFTYENNLRYEGNYDWKTTGHTETICKTKLKQPKVKWLVNTIMDKRKVTI